MCDGGGCCEYAIWRCMCRTRHVEFRMLFLSSKEMMQRENSKQPRRRNCLRKTKTLNTNSKISETAQKIE